MTNVDQIDSKYRFVIIASKRAKELLKGAKARIKSRSKNPVRIAQKEVEMGLVEFEILKSKEGEVSDQEERVFLGEEIGVGPEEEGAADVGADIFGEEEADEEKEEKEEKEEEEEEEEIEEEESDSDEDAEEENEEEGEEEEEN